MKKLLFIYNPRAGKGQIRAHLPEILDIFTKAGYLVMARPTQYAGEAAAFIRDWDEPCDLVVCSGGDGTLDEVVDGLMKSPLKCPVGYVPAGSTNDFANSLHLPRDMKRSAAAAVGGSPFLCDVGVFNDRTFVYIAAFGLLTEVSYETPQEIKNVLGHMAYVLEGVKKLGAVRSFPLKVTAGETVIEGDFLYGMVTNSTSVGGFEGITGKFVDLSDGLFEVTLIRRPRNLEEFNRILSALATQNIDTDLMYCFKTARLEVESKEEVSWTLDGEFGGRHTSVVIENRKRALPIMAPAE